jgi:hypothetical protein
MNTGIIITELLKVANKRREKTLKPDDQSRNLYSPIFLSIPGIKKSTKREVAEPKIYIRLTFFSPEKTERKLELI